MPHAHPCRHLHTSGRQCGSPALRGEPFCFYHHTARKPMPRRAGDGHTLPQLPAPEDFLAIQRGIGEVLRLLALDSLTDRRAQTLLRGLAAASANLARHHRHEARLVAQATNQLANQAANQAANQLDATLPDPVTDYINDPTHGTLALPPNPDPNEISDQSPDDRHPTPNTPHPDPIPLLTPDPSPNTSYDDAKLTEIHQRFETIFRQKLARYEHQKSLELEALYDARYAELEAHFQPRQPQPHPETPIQTPPQPNQDFTNHQEKTLALAS